MKKLLMVVAVMGLSACADMRTRHDGFYMPDEDAFQTRQYEMNNARLESASNNFQGAIDAADDMRRAFGKKKRRAPARPADMPMIERNQCGSVTLPPLASPGCRNICINGRWAEVC